MMMIIMRSNIESEHHLELNDTPNVIWATINGSFYISINCDIVGAKIFRVIFCIIIERIFVTVCEGAHVEVGIFSKVDDML